jgi:hypothetical protein
MDRLADTGDPQVARSAAWGPGQERAAADSGRADPVTLWVVLMRDAPDPVREPPRRHL